MLSHLSVNTFLFIFCLICEPTTYLIAYNLTFSFRSKKQQHETTTSITFPFLTSDDENNDRANEEAISILKKLPDYTVETSETGSLFADLIIKESEEFSNRTFTALLSDLPWTEKLLTQRVEDTFYHGKHMTFCRLHNDTLAVVRIYYNF